MKVWTMEIPVLSTAHMPHSRAASECHRVAEYAEGAFVFIGGRGGGFQQPDWLKPVAEWVWATYGETTSWVRFDGAGDVVNQLETWEW